MKRLLLITVALTAFACDVEENDCRDESGETSQAGDLRDTDHMGGKADKATVDEDSTSLADEFDYCGELTSTMMVNATDFVGKKILIARASRTTKKTS